MKHVLELQPNLTIFQAMVDGLIVSNNQCIGVNTSIGLNFYAKSIVVTTGTFLWHQLIGQTKSDSGRLEIMLQKDYLHFLKHDKLIDSKREHPCAGKSLNLSDLEIQWR